MSGCPSPRFDLDFPEAVDVCEGSLLQITMAVQDSTIPRTLLKREYIRGE